MKMSWMLMSGIIVLACGFADARAPGPGRGGRDEVREIDNLSGLRGSVRFFKVDVDRGTSGLNIRTVGGRGDFDIYVRYGSNPSTRQHDYTTRGRVSRDGIRIDHPQAGAWYVMIHGRSSYSNVTLRVEFESGPSSVAPRPDPWHGHRPTPAQRSGDIRLDSPRAGETWQLGESYTVKWSCRNVQRVQVQFSLDDGRTWEIGRLEKWYEASRGGLRIEIPNERRYVSDTVRIRIVDYDNDRVSALSDRFTIVGRGRRIGTGRRNTIREDRYENDNSAKQAGFIRLNETQERSIFPRRDEDWLEFENFRPGRYVLSFTSETGLDVEVYTRDRRDRLTSQGSRRITSTGQITITLMSAQECLIRVKSARRNDVGNYTLTARRD